MQNPPPEEAPLRRPTLLREYHWYKQPGTLVFLSILGILALVLLYWWLGEHLKHKKYENEIEAARARAKTSLTEESSASSSNPTTDVTSETRKKSAAVRPQSSIEDRINEYDRELRKELKTVFNSHRDELQKVANDLSSLTTGVKDLKEVVSTVGQKVTNSKTAVDWLQSELQTNRNELNLISARQTSVEQMSTSQISRLTGEIAELKVRSSAAPTSTTPVGNTQAPVAQTAAPPPTVVTPAPVAIAPAASAAPVSTVATIDPNLTATGISLDQGLKTSCAPRYQLVYPGQSIRFTARELQRKNVRVLRMDNTAVNDQDGVVAQVIARRSSHTQPFPHPQFGSRFLSTTEEVVFSGTKPFRVEWLD
jgi:hypothetical protein